MYLCVNDMRMKKKVRKYARKRGIPSLYNSWLGSLESSRGTVARAFIARLFARVLPLTLYFI